jgi:hemerythrin-like metal-binding protein
LPSFEIGIQEIDADHGKLFDMVVRVQEAIRQHDRNHCSGLVESFIQEATQHFEREEQYLIRIRYPKIKEHQEYHKSLAYQGTRVKVNVRQ